MEANANFYCKLCDKFFKCGKARGGHMRIHNSGAKAGHRPKLAMAGYLAEFDMRCSICSKVFPNIKSLSGHMRSHPERDWRGINPPAGGSSLSWRREDDDPPPFEVVEALLMLARGGHDNVDEGVKKRKFEALEAVKLYRCSTCEKDFDSPQALGGHTAGHNKLIKIDFEDEGDDDEEEEKELLTSNDDEEEDDHEEDQLHRCEKCSKVFTSGQALGGHKRSHWVVPLPKLTAGASTSSSSSVEDVAAAGHRRVFNFDLNQLPPIEPIKDAASTYFAFDF